MNYSRAFSSRFLEGRDVTDLEEQDVPNPRNPTDDRGSVLDSGFDGESSISIDNGVSFFYTEDEQEYKANYKDPMVSIVYFTNIIHFICSSKHTHCVGCRIILIAMQYFMECLTEVVVPVEFNTPLQFLFQILL